MSCFINSAELWNNPQLQRKDKDEDTSEAQYCLPPPHPGDILQTYGWGKTQIHASLLKLKVVDPGFYIEIS